MKKAAMFSRARKEGIQVGYDMSMRCRLVRPLAMQSMIVAMQLQVLLCYSSIPPADGRLLISNCNWGLTYLINV